MKRLMLLFVSAILLLAEPAHADIQVGAAAPDFTAEAAGETSATLSDFKGKYVVLEWTNFECPYVRKHYDSGNMQQLQKTYTGKDVVWLTIISSAPGEQGYLESAELVEAGRKEGSNATHLLSDPTGVIGRMYAASNTPHMYVIDPEGKLIYSGAIDSVASADKGDIEGAENYVVAALDAAMAGNPVETSFTRPYGCNVKYE